MKSLKSLLALSIAMVVSGAALAESSNPLAGLENSAKTAVQEMKTDAKSKMANVEQGLSAEKTKVADKLSAEKSKIADKMQNDKGSSMLDKAKAEKNALAEKMSAKKTEVTEKLKAEKNALENKAKNLEKDAKAAISKGSKVNVNKADAKTLQSLAGIGESKAQAIIDYRNKVGKIKNIEELAKVSGIGEATLEKIKPFVSF